MKPDAGAQDLDPGPGLLYRGLRALPSTRCPLTGTRVVNELVSSLCRARGALNRESQALSVGGNMILFQCPSCREVCRADDSAAGTTVVCEKCKARVQVPEKTPEGLYLLFQDGGPDGGVPVTEARLQELWRNGKLEASDLVWLADGWHPVYDLLPERTEGNAEVVREDTLALHLAPLTPNGEDDVLDDLPRLGERIEHDEGREISDAAVLSDSGSEPAPADGGSSKTAAVVTTLFLLLIALGITAFVVYVLH